MSIRGIDTQMMVTRTTEMTRDANAVQRKDGLMQDYLAVQGKAADEQQKNMVLETIAPEQAGIQPDKEGDGGGYKGSGKRRGKDEDEDEDGGILDVNKKILMQLRDNGHTIDIEV